MPKLKAICYSTLFFTGVFSVVFYFGEWDRLVNVALMGFFIGIVTAPELNPEHFKYDWIYQLVAGSFAGAVLGHILGGDSEIIAMFTIGGGVLGFIGPYWIKHVQIP